MPDETGDSGATPDDALTPDGATPDGPAGDERDADAGSTDDATTGGRDRRQEVLTKERAARRDAEQRAAEAERRLQELEDVGKSELERTTSRLERTTSELEQERTARHDAEQRLADLELLELKRTVCADVGIPLDAAHRLQGTDVRTIKADAQRYLEERKGAVGDLGGGRGGTASGRSGADMNTLIRQATGRN